MDKTITPEDLKNLEAVFIYARKFVAENEQELIAVINFRQNLFEKLKPEETQKENG